MGEASGILENNNLNIKIKKMMKGGQIKNAIDLCISALNNDPTNADLHLRLGDLYFAWHLDIHQARHYLDEAITEYQRALESDINSSLVHYKIGIAFYHKGDSDKAMNHFNLSIESNPTLADSYYMIAKILYKKDRISESFFNLKKAIKYGGFSSSRAHSLYLTLLKSKSAKDFTVHLEIIWHYILAFLTFPFDQIAVRDLFKRLSYIKFFPVLIKGIYLERIRNVHKAIEVYTQAIEKTPGYLPLYLMLGDVYRSIGKINDALNEYRMALWLDSTNILAYKALCSVYEEQGDYDNAIKIYDKLIEIYPNDAIYHSNLGNIYYLKGELKSAISCYQSAITLNPNKNWTSVIAQTLGFILQESKENYDAAISAYQSAFLLNPGDIDIYISLASAFYDKGDYNNALAVYRVALEVSPDNPRIHCNLGYLLWGKGMLDESIKEYETAIKLDSTYDIAYNNLGVIYLDDLGYLQKAIDLFEQAIKYNPNYALAYYNKGRAFALKGDKIEAARLYQLSLDLNSFTNELDGNEVKSRIKDLFD